MRGGSRIETQVRSPGKNILKTRRNDVNHGLEKLCVYLGINPGFKATRYIFHSISTARKAVLAVALVKGQAMAASNMALFSMAFLCIMSIGR